jgi:hypothetical protein
MPGELETRRVENMFFHIRFCFTFLSSGFIIFMFMFLHIVFFSFASVFAGFVQGRLPIQVSTSKTFSKTLLSFLFMICSLFFVFLPQFLLGSSKEWRINNISTRGHIKKRKKKRENENEKKNENQNEKIMKTKFGNEKDERNVSTCLCHQLQISHNTRLRWADGFISRISLQVNVITWWLTVIWFSDLD